SPAASRRGCCGCSASASPPTRNTRTGSCTASTLEGAAMSWLPDYAELHCLSNFSFQRGASHPQELVLRAHELGYAALAITDECSVAGVVRAYAEAKKLNLKLLLGAEFALDGFRLVALARHATGWGNLCEFITHARRIAE